MITFFRRLLALCLTFILLLAMAAAYVVHRTGQELQRPLSISQPTEWTLNKGASTIGLANQWSKQGWIETSFWIKVAVRLDSSLTKIKAGTYELTPGVSVRQQLEKIIRGEQKAFYLTLVEGETVKQALARIKAHPKLTLTHTPESLAKLIDFDGANPEGMLFPDTYQFHLGETDSALLTRAAKRMRTEIDAVWKLRANQLPLKSSYEMVILASIIEKETGVAAERPLIASVFVNRLRKGMRLQTDPTVIYGMGERFDGDIRRQDLREKTPYNTYRINGLPPTPIALVGREALEAAARPLDSNMYYFVAKGDGSHQFSQTLAEHNRAVNQYIRNK